MQTSEDKYLAKEIELRMQGKLILWKDCQSSNCKHAYAGTPLWDGWAVIAEVIDDGYEGSVYFIATCRGRWCIAGWGWGSCSGCDSWEDTDEAQICKDMKESTEWFENYADMRARIDLYAGFLPPPKEGYWPPVAKETAAVFRDTLEQLFGATLWAYFTRSPTSRSSSRILIKRFRHYVTTLLGSVETMLPGVSTIATISKIARTSTEEIEASARTCLGRITQ